MAAKDESRLKEHRVKTASAAYQKGIYHLYVLNHQESFDVFAHVLRTYQCVFLLGVAEALLDFEGMALPDNDRTRRDPATAIEHHMLRKWPGYVSGHPLHEVSQRTKKLLDSVIEARHEVIYRPSNIDLGNKWHWDDCTLKELSQDIPQPREVEVAYKQFYKAIIKWEEMEIEETNKNSRHYPYIAFWVTYIRNRFESANITLIEAYTRSLSPSNPKLVEEVSRYFEQISQK